MSTSFEHTQGQTLTHYGKLFHLFCSHSIGKFVGVILLTLCLMFPLGLIENQITTREQYQDQVAKDIAISAASPQTIIGPVLAIYYRTKTREMHQDGGVIRKAGQIREHLEYLPARKLTVQGSTQVEHRKRGIYRASLFHLDAGLEGMFEIPDDVIKIPDGEEFVDSHAAILFGVSDLRGITSDSEVQVDGRPLYFKASNDKRFDSVMRGKRLEIELGAWAPNNALTLAFHFPLRLTGTQTLSIAPTAEINIVDLKSTWKDPSFGGRFLPRKHDLGGEGFTAHWEISQLARNLEDALNGNSEVLNVGFIDPVNIYLQAERAVKYGILFIVLTFAAFFIGEALRRRPMHIVQYALVGLSLAVFFLLLIALSEHLSFAMAYLIGAVACIGLIVGYLAGVFKSWRTALIFGGGLSALYGVLFVILQLEGMALLMGSLLLFVALAAAMLTTRRFDWYQRKHDEMSTDTSEKE